MAVRYLSIRLDDSLRARVKAAAAADRRSVAIWVALVLERELAAAENRARSKQEARS